MEKRYGKNINLAKLKPNVIHNLKEHLKAQLKMIEFLSKNHVSLSQKSCYVCGSEVVTPVATIHGFVYVKCNNCELFFTTKRFSEEAIQDFYKKNEYYSQTTYANKESCFYRRENVARPKVEFLEQYVAGRGKWIDVGAGIGDLVSVAKEKGWEATGLELSDSSIKFSKQIFGLNLIQKPLEKYAKENPDLSGQVDVISFIGVIEHTVNPLELLRIAHNLLKTNGHIMLQVPNADSLTSMLQSIFPENVFRHMNPLEHIMLFSQKSLIKALKITGFEPKAIWFHGMDIYELLNNLSLLNEKVDDSPFYKTIFAHMNELQYVFDKEELSDRIICVAKVIK